MASTASRWLPLLVLLGLAGLALYLLRAPAPRPATAPAAEFAAGRALPDVQALARAPHPIGSPAQAAARDYLLGRLRALGLAEVRVERGVGIEGSRQRGVPGALGRVENLTARLPGSAPGGPAVLLLAHYDSQPHAPGAGDDGAGVATILETLRALQAGPPLRHDVRVLLTDGEEAGLLGARAYCADSARRRREVGVVLNVEGRGNRGPSLMFEVSGQNGALIRALRQAAPAPIASSLFYEAYRHLPNDTDFTPFRQSGVPGLNLAFVDGYPYYHSPADRPQHLDPASVQHHGSYLLALARHFGREAPDLRQLAAPDHTFFNPLGTWLVAYPTAWALPLTGLTWLLLLLAAALARQRGRLSWGGLLGGLVAWLGALLLVLGLTWAGQALLQGLFPGNGLFYARAGYNALPLQAALLALALAGLGLYYGWLGRILRPDALAGGALLAVGLLLALEQWRAPSAAYLLAWPLLAATLGWAARLRRRTPSRALRPGSGWGAALAAAPAVALLVPVGYLLLVIFGVSALVLLAGLVLTLLVGLLLPTLGPVLNPPPRPGRPPRASAALPALALATALVALGMGYAGRGFTPERPGLSHLFYLLDADQRRAEWLSANPRPDRWTAPVLGDSARYGTPALLPDFGPLLHQAAPLAPGLAPPTALRLPDSLASGGRRLVRLRVAAGRAGVSSLRLRLAEPGRVRAWRWAGVPLPPAAAADLSFFAPRPEGELLELELSPGAGPLGFTLTSRAIGLPALAPPRPADLVPAPGYLSNTTLVRRAFRL